MTRVTKRPPLRYYGSGWQRAPWIINHFPAHDVYCEPCFGSGAVLLRKPPAKLEIANDLDGRVVTFFETLRRQPDDLLRAINLTPWHEAAFKQALIPAADPLEDARRFFFACWASVKGGPLPGPSDFRWQKKLTRRSAAVQDVANLDHLLAAAARLKNVQFVQKDALDLIGKMAGTGALIYFDPPYLHRTRANRLGYRHEPDDDWHVAAAGCCETTTARSSSPAMRPTCTGGCMRRMAGDGWSARSAPTAAGRPPNASGCRPCATLRPMPQFRGGRNHGLGVQGQQPLLLPQAPAVRPCGQ